ncbi:MAG TPA: cation-translocating P-type ATPase [Microthrixaceae bacterium]|nr:cation-translocating P-type ATPase [Microthrixaceae bacterium]
MIQHSDGSLNRPDHVDLEEFAAHAHEPTHNIGVIGPGRLLMTSASESSYRDTVHLQSASEVARSIDTDIELGLTKAEAAKRLERFGANELRSEPPPSLWTVGWGQLGNPMNIMLLIVAFASFAIGQVATGMVVAALVTFNVVMGTNQELKARSSVDALSKLQIPHARVRRDGQVAEVAATDLVPGDIVLVEAGDLVPADGRLVTSATLEVQEAALTGESAPIAKDPGTLDNAETSLGDRTNMVFQNTQVTRGSASLIVTATGAATEMGRIADMVNVTQRSKSPLQRELDGMTKVFGFLAWGAVTVIAGVGIARGQDGETLALLCISTAIASIPTGLPTFVQTMLSSGARRLADEKAVVRSLADVETLGGTTVINSDKTGTLTMNAMTVSSMYAGGNWYRVQGSGYSKAGAILGIAGSNLPDFTPLALGLSLCSDATVDDYGSIIGDPTEAALVVLAAKMGIDAEQTRHLIPRLAEVPFDSDYKFMATFHDRPSTMRSAVVGQSHFMAVKGGPDVVLDRCSGVLHEGLIVPVAELRDEVLEANRGLSEKGLRVLAFAAKGLDDSMMGSARKDPMAAVTDLVLVGLVGIIDPLRTEAADAVKVALHAGIDVRMITGDHTITARAIADQLGLGAGVVTGNDLQHMSDEEVVARLPQLHVFGRVAPEDKLRLAKLMQDAGEVVAMTGDAVNDAAALKQADIGVAMGSGSEVSKQAAKIVLTDDNFATLVRAVDLGRDIYRRISSYIKLQLTVLSSVLQLMVFATLFNINGGVALFPMQLLFCKFFVVVTVVVGFIKDVPDPGVMDLPPRQPGTRIVNPPQIVRWAISGFLVAVCALAVLEFGPDEPSATVGSVSMTMAFAVVALSAVNLGVVMRRERQAPWSTPMFPYFGWLIAGWSLTWAAVELRMLQRLLDTVSMTGGQWLVAIGLSFITPAFVGVDKAIQFHRLDRFKDETGPDGRAPDGLAVAGGDPVRGGSGETQPLPSMHRQAQM